MATRLLAIALIVGLLAGCTGSSGGGSKPTPTPSPTSSTTSLVTSPSPSPDRTGPLTTGPNVRPGEKPPVFPSVGRIRSREGALAVAIYYFRAFDWGYATNDGSLVRGVASPTCSGCRTYLDGLASLKKNNEVLVGGRAKIVSYSVARNTYRVSAEFVADVAIDEEPVVLRGAQSTRTAAPAARDLHSLVFLDWRHGRWLVVDVTKP